MINFVVALPSEAQSLISSFDLKRDSRADLFPVYLGTSRRIVVSGPGKDNAARAANYLHSYSGFPMREAWLNIGIGGHRTHALKSAFLAHKIQDEATGRNWYPPLILKQVLPTEIVQTIDYVEREYNNDWIYEMEAAGFYNTVSRFTTSELIQCIKIISDNQSSSTEKVSAKQVESLVEGNLEAIERVVLGLDALAKELESRERAPEKFEHVLKKFHFTVTEQRKLKRLLKRLETLDINPEIWESQISQLKNTNGVIRALEAQIEATPLQL